MTSLVRRTLAAAVALLLIGACGTRGIDAPTVTPTPEAPIMVFAAASLTGAFTQIGTDFHLSSGHSVRFNFGSSATLATQITQGAPR